MLTIENTETCGWAAAIRGMRNPKNSWEKSDSAVNCFDDTDGVPEFLTHIGPNDLHLMTTLANAGTDHGKFLRMITVYLDITAPLYWWKEFDTYKVGTVANSCSTMHKIAAKEFTPDDFSREHLTPESHDLLLRIIAVLNDAREVFSHYEHMKTDGEIDEDTPKKSYWWQMIQMLPTSYNQRRTVMLNYAVLRNMYNARKAHKLDEWHTFCDWIESLPYASELICNNGGDKA